MDKGKAIELLKQALTEIPHLKKLRYNNQKYRLWFSKVRVILEDTFGGNSREYKVFSSSGSRAHIKMPVIPDSFYQDDYLANLESHETALKSIIQKYKILGIEEKPSVIEVPPEAILREVSPKAFISHGKKSAALRKLKEFIETLGIETLIAEKQASLDKDVPDKVNLYLSQADFVIILATGDDTVKDKITTKEIIQPRQNVIHEIGLAQKTHPGRIIYLLEEGTEFPSNIRARVWESFKQRNMMNAFLGIVRELRAYRMLKVTKYPIEE